MCLAQVVRSNGLILIRNKNVSDSCCRFLASHLEYFYVVVVGHVSVCESVRESAARTRARMYAMCKGVSKRQGGVARVMMIVCALVSVCASVCLSLSLSVCMSLCVGGSGFKGGVAWWHKAAQYF